MIEEYKELNDLDLLLKALGIKSSLFVEADDLPVGTAPGGTYDKYVEISKAFKERLVNENRGI